MNIYEEVMKCSERVSFPAVRYDFSYGSSDKKTLDSLTAEGTQLASMVNPTLARNASRQRDFQTVLRNCIGGVIAEYCWRDRLGSESKRLNSNVGITKPTFSSATKQIDMVVAYPNGQDSRVEVRSSFAYKGVKSAVCRNFDILGWYVNPVKKAEIKKDYYVRTVYDFDTLELYDKIKADPFCVYLTGGATKHLLETGPNSRDKKLIPYDDIDAQVSSQNGIYRVVEPIKNGYDTDKITRYILGHTST